MFADLFTPEQLTILTQIILIDLVLAGDNAIIIGMVASKFPLEQRKKIIFFGIGGAGTSICYSLIRAKARRLKLINRNTNKLNLLVNKLKNLKSNTKILIDDFRDYDISPSLKDFTYRFISFTTHYYIVAHCNVLESFKLTTNKPWDFTFVSNYSINA